jgi:two-component system nitrogen regulation sensor histidine kinase NtrY
LLKPITNVIDATNSIKEGSFNISLPQSNEFIELNRLSESFNAMSSELSIQRNLLANSEKHAAWSEIAKTIAHEIKNPLTPIQLSNDRIRKKLEDANIDDPIITECLNIISRQVGDIGKLVNDFSNFARMPKPIFTHNNLKTIIKNCVETKSLEYQDKINFKVKCEDKFIINCDELQLTQVFNNVIQNSMNSILENDILKGMIDIDVNKINKKIIIKVKDNGVGIINTKSELIEPYFSTRKKTGGTGLGLSIVNKIITDHDGILELENNTDSGLCVKITFNK